MEDYKNPALPVERRVEDLLARMTLEEKVAQLCCHALPENCEEDALQEAFSQGMGTLNVLNATLSGYENRDKERLQKVQAYLRSHTRLGISVLPHSEAIAGAQIPGATAFPQSLGMAATWCPTLAFEMGEAVRRQLKAFGIFAAHSPLFDLGRDPRWGRIGETYGESPLLVAQMGTQFVLGLQGKDEVMATAKHFLAYGNALGGRNGGQVDLSERALRDEYGFPFEAAIQVGRVQAVMNSYGTLNREPIVTSRHWLTGVLRGEMGFRGALMSDYGSVERSCNRYGTAADRRQAAVQALYAGVDVDQPDGSCFATLAEAVHDGQVETEVLDAAVRRVLTLKFRLGLFESTAPQGEFRQIARAPRSLALAKKIARSSIVLAKNDGILPLRSGLRVALVGPSADNCLYFFGGYSSVGTVNTTTLDFNRSELDNFRRMMLKKYITGQRERLASLGIVFEDAPTPEQEQQILEVVSRDLAARNQTKAYQGPEDFLAQFYPDCRTVRQWLEEALGPQNVIYAPGSGPKLPLPGGIREAVAAARSADVVVAVVGGQESMRSPDATCGENKDNTNIGLEPPQRELLDALYRVGKPVVTVVVDGRPLALPEEDANSAALLYAWLPGECGGEAIVDVLLGRVNPGGKMPVTILRHAGQIPMYHDLQPLFDRPDHPAEYLDRASNKPLYPFGHGLSYTTFAYENLTVDPRTLCGGSVKISFTLTNTGALAGEEVAQIYYHDREAPLVRPMSQLCGFVRVALKPGESCQVRVEVDTHQFAYHGPDHQLTIYPGRRDLMIGASSTDIRLRGGFVLTGEPLAVKQRSFFPVVSRASVPE